MERVTQSDVLAYIKQRPATAKEAAIDLGLSFGAALNRMKRLAERDLIKCAGFPRIYYFGDGMTIQPTMNKAAHTVAIRNLLPIAEQKMREKKWKEARVLLSDAREHAWQLIQWLDTQTEE